MELEHYLLKAQDVLGKVLLLKSLENMNTEVIFS